MHLTFESWIANNKLIKSGSFLYYAHKYQDILYTTKILVSGNLFLVGLIYTMNIIAIILNKIRKKIKHT